MKKDKLSIKAIENAAMIAHLKLTKRQINALLNGKSVEVSCPSEQTQLVSRRDSVKSDKSKPSYLDPSLPSSYKQPNPLGGLLGSNGISLGGGWWLGGEFSADRITIRITYTK
ncbi:MAG: hypothetical protein HXX16_19220 [Bacteroidales bacterium]|nr:hypothetical protein [Bacteroidales bacterium]